METGELLSQTPISLNKAMQAIVKKTYNEALLDDVKIERITYPSDDLKINGYLARPNADGTYPVLIWNRGGFGENGALDDLRAMLILGSTAQWGYVVLATQYRGNMGSEGTEDWGGRDVNDALNLIPVAENIDYCDSERMAIEGASRGGMTTYIALTREDRFKCAITHAGVADLFTLTETRGGLAEWIDAFFGELPVSDKERKLSERSAVYFADRFPDKVPLLLIHGTDDKRVPISQSEALAEELKRYDKPFEFVKIEGAGHIALKDGSYQEVDKHRKKWLAKHLG